MNRINYSRVLFGGLAAGVVLTIAEFIVNELILGNRWRAAMESLGVEAPGVGSTILYAVLTLILGIAVVWLYAAIRPRYGAGPRTALCSGLFVWFLVWLWCFGGSMVWAGFFPAGLVVVVVICGLVEVLLAALVGGWVYREASVSTPESAG